MSTPSEPAELAQAAFAPFRTDLIAWLDEHTHLDPETDRATVIDVLAATAGAVIAERPEPDPAATHYTAQDIVTLRTRVLPDLIDAVSDTDQPELLGDLELDLLMLWTHFLAFLDDTGRWTGSETDVDQCFALLQPEDDDMQEVLAEAAEAVPLDLELSTLAASFPIQVAEALIRLVGSGIEVPEDEDLTPDQVQTVLASLEAQLPPTSGQPEAPRRIDDVPWVRQVLITLLELDVLAENEAGTRLLPAAQLPLFTGDPVEDEDCLDLRREVVGQFILGDPRADDQPFSLESAAMPAIIAAAATGRPVDPESLAGLVDSEGPLGALATDAVEGLQRRIDELVSFGILTPAEPPWAVHPGYIPSLEVGIEEMFVDDDDEEFDDLDISELAEALQGLPFGEAEQEELRKLLGGR